MKSIVITGSSGLIGSEAVMYFSNAGYHVHGIDNNKRAFFLGSQGDTSRNARRLRERVKSYEHHDIDILERSRILELFEKHRPSAIMHCAAQPSHEAARLFPFQDFEVNAVGTLNLLEAARLYCPESPFVFMSTNKVYGDAPNELPLLELPTRWEYARPEDHDGVTENCRIDQSTHGPFGVSKAAADLMVQEYGRYYSLPTVCFRGSCLTGPYHAGVESHGFLSYLVKTIVAGRKYTIFGYKGKQVRDQIHSFDVVRAAQEFIESPRKGEVYNLGGGRPNSASVLECIDKIQHYAETKAVVEYQERHRTGDHICYITNLAKFKGHYPRWSATKGLDDIIRELVEFESAQGSTGHAD